MVNTEYGSMDKSRDVFKFLPCTLNDSVTSYPLLCLKIHFILAFNVCSSNTRVQQRHLNVVFNQFVCQKS